MGERERRRRKEEGGGGRRKSLVGFSSLPVRVPPPGSAPGAASGVRGAGGKVGCGMRQATGW